MQDLSEPHLALWERVRFAPLWLRLKPQGELFSAEPFERWSSKCPACGRAYPLHEATILSAAFPPATEFVSSVEDHDWEAAHRLGTGPEPIGHRDLVVAWVLRCPIENRLVVFLALDPHGLAPAQLISQQILTSRLAQELLPYLETFRPAVRDTFAGVVELSRRSRALRRSLSWRTRLREFSLTSILPLALGAFIGIAVLWCANRPA